MLTLAFRIKQHITNIINAWDVGPGTVNRDVGVFIGSLRGNPNRATIDGTLAGKLAFISGGVFFACAIGLGISLMQKRNQYLQRCSKEYFLWKLFKLKQYFSQLHSNLHLEDLEVTTHVSSQILSDSVEERQLKNALYYYGEQDIWLTQKYRALFKAYGLDLAKLKDSKAELMSQAIAALYKQYFLERSENYEDESQSKNDVLDVTEDLSSLTWQKQIANKLIKLIDTITNSKYLNVTADSMYLYMMGYWFVWSAAWIITGLASLTSALMIGITFGLPLIPVAICILSSFAKEGQSTQVDNLYEINREIFIKHVFTGLAETVDLQVKRLAQLGYTRSTAQSLVRQAENKYSYVQATLDNINTKFRRKVTMSFVTGLVTGFILVEFMAWPATAFLCAIGVAAAGGPIVILATAVIALVFGLFLGVKRARKTYLDETEVQEKAHHNHDELKNLITFEKKNAALEDELHALYEKAKELLDKGDYENKESILNALKPIYAPQSISTQDRLFRRMDMTTSTRTPIKKGLHRAWIWLAAAGSGILVIRLLCGAGCVLALHNPFVFISLAATLGLIWGCYRVFQHCVMQQSSRDAAIVNESKCRLSAETQKNTFLLEQLRRKTGVVQEIETEIQNRSQPVLEQKRSI